MSGILLLSLRFLLTAVLYVFLAWVVLILWRDLRRQSQQIDAAQIPQLGLYPQADSNLMPVTFQVTEVLVGRDARSDFILTDPTISSRHARLFYNQDQWWVEDLGSTNGTLINGHRLDTPTVITHGDQLQLGQIEFLVTIDLFDSAEVSEA